MVSRQDRAIREFDADRLPSIGLRRRDVRPAERKQLVSRNADWARFLSAGKQVTFRTGKTTVVAVGEQGKEKLTEAELKALEK